MASSERQIWSETQRQVRDVCVLYKTLSAVRSSSDCRSSSVRAAQKRVEYEMCGAFLLTLEHYAGEKNHQKGLVIYPALVEMQRDLLHQSFCTRNIQFCRGGQHAHELCFWSHPRRPATDHHHMSMDVHSCKR